MMKKSIEDVLKKHTNELMSVRGVHGIGQGLCDGDPCIKIFVSELSADARKKIPDQLDGYPVKIEKTGPFRASR